MESAFNRRRFLALVTETIVALIGQILAVAAIGYIWAPLVRNVDADNAGDGFADSGALTDLPLGQWRLVTLEVVRRGGREQKARARHAVWVRRIAF